MILWITVDDIVHFHGLKPQHLNLERTDTTGLNSIISDWILQCQDLINHYTNREYTDSTVPAAVQNVCLRLTSNMVALAVQRRDNPIIKVNDWTVQAIGSDIFTDDLKDDLAPFISDSRNDYSKFDIFAITGADDEDGSDQH